MLYGFRNDEYLIVLSADTEEKAWEELAHYEMSNEIQHVKEDWHLRYMGDVLDIDAFYAD